MTRFARFATIAASAVVLASCLSPNIAELVDPQSRFPDGTRAAWSGQTSLRAMNINPPPMRGADTPRAGPADVATVYVTRDSVLLDLGPGSGRPNSHLCLRTAPCIQGPRAARIVTSWSSTASCPKAGNSRNRAACQRWPLDPQPRSAHRRTRWRLARPAGTRRALAQPVHCPRLARSHGEGQMAGESRTRTAPAASGPHDRSRRSAAAQSGSRELDRVEFDEEPLTRYAEGNDEATQTPGSAEAGIP